MNCRVCLTPTRPVLDLGRMPLANAFLTAEQFEHEFHYLLGVARCPRCGMVQLVDSVDPRRIFHANYPYFSSTSKGMIRHFGNFARETLSDARAAAADPFVVEIGSNDGIMLRHFVEAGIRCLGIEPSSNVAAVARTHNVPTLEAFFDAETANFIRSEHGPAHALLGANVVCHIPDIHETFKAARILLAREGVFRFEDPYLGDIVRQSAVDQIYDEHVFYFSIGSIAYMAAAHGLELIDAEPQAVHGGSMRYTLVPAGSRMPTARLQALMQREASLGLNDESTYARFRSQIEEIRRDLVGVLHKLRRGGARVVGFGATAKSATLLNYCQIGPDLVEFISDSTPAKQHKFSPGMHIPVKPFAAFTERFPDCALLLAWNHAEEIIAANANFIANGGRWIHYVPVVRVV